MMGRDYLNQSRAAGAGPAGLDPDLVQIVRNLAVAHAREDYRRATGQLDEGDEAVRRALAEHLRAKGYLAGEQSLSEVI